MVGSWTKISGGFIYGTSASSGDKGNTGNTGTGTATSKNNGNTGSTTLTEDQIPWHQHMIGRNWGGTGFAIPYGDPVNGWRLQDSGGTDCVKTKGTGGGQGHTHTLNNHQHDIPYIECYIWKRTS